MHILTGTKFASKYRARDVKIGSVDYSVDPISPELLRDIIPRRLLQKSISQGRRNRVYNLAGALGNHLVLHSSVSGIKTSGSSGSKPITAGVILSRCSERDVVQHGGLMFDEFSDGLGLFEQRRREVVLNLGCGT